ncbi:family 16 glycosylhydrolase [Actinomadura scrupuli]|uniref:golvesin C-terminal-like domain-containing protein n=1 Tax=Actinomadura scrupuli TaxID=559629 RepID=UPI003D979237
MYRRSWRAGTALVLLAATAFAISSPGPAATAAPAPAPAPAGYEQAWADEFDGTGLDTGQWFHRGGDRALCTNKPENVDVSGGYLRLKLDKATSGKMPYTCGGVITRQLFGYGYYETRAKQFSGPGWHSSFWQMGVPLDHERRVPDYTGPNNLVNEVDGFEIDSHTPTRVQANSHYYTPTHVGWGGGISTGVDSTDGYHTYGYEWTPTKLRFYTDGVLTVEKDYPGPHAPQNLWLTSVAYTEPVDDGALPGEVTYDYFRYYRPIAAGDEDPAVVVDTSDSGYAETGEWTSSPTPWAYGFQDKDTRQSSAAGATASWTPALPAAGSYEVYAWNPSVFNGSNTSARFTVTHGGGSTDVLVDQVTAGQQWVSLGAYQLVPGDKVTVRGEGTGALRTDAVKFVPAVVTDNGSSGYTESGPWNASATVPGWRGTGTRWATAGASTARWTPDLPSATTYDVFAWIPRNATDSTSAAFTVVHNGTTSSVDPDERMGVNRWVKLGNFDFAAGTGGYVQLGQGVTAGLIRADAVKFVAAAPPDTMAPPVPTGVTASAAAARATGDATLTWRWKPVAAADLVGYHVYLDGVRMTWNPVRRTGFTMHRMKPGQRYSLTVTAVDHSGNESAPSRVVNKGIPADTAAPATPAPVAAELANGQVILTWAANTEYDVLGYHVYKDGVRVDEEQWGWGGPPTAETLRGYSVTGLTNNRAYTFRVTAVDYSGHESAARTVVATPLPIAVVDGGGPGYSETGTWSASSLVGWNNSTTRATGAPTATATWTPELAWDGAYDVYAWVPQHTNSTAKATYTVNHTAGQTAVDVSQKTGGNQWVLLGRYEFTTAGTGHVTIANGAGSGYLRTDAVKFVPTFPTP